MITQFITIHNLLVSSVHIRLSSIAKISKIAIGGQVVISICNFVLSSPAYVLQIKLHDPWNLIHSTHEVICQNVFFCFIETKIHHIFQELMWTGFTNRKQQNEIGYFCGMTLVYNITYAVSSVFPILFNCKVLVMTDTCRK